MLWTESSDVFVEFKKRLIAASRSGQFAFEILQEYLIPVHGLSFNRRGLANAWEPETGILLDHLVQFGAPCIKGTRIPTEALWSMGKVGDSKEYLAASYELSNELLDKALAWENEIRRN
jgi:uncharacterized protein (DUF433 family)